jgi:hypothetical protein
LKTDPSPVRRRRRTKDEIRGLRAALYAIVAEEPPMTVRQVFYQAVGRGLVPKAERAYKNTVCEQLTAMRRSGMLPYSWLADSTRWQRKPVTHSGLEGALRRTAEAYRRSIWDRQAAYVEVWLEKEALAGVVYRATQAWDVPLMVTRGYPSLSYLHTAAESIAAEGKPAHIYYFGDYDPSGVNISAVTERELRAMAPGAEIRFERVAVEPWQIEAWGLPTRPTKATDSRSKGFGDASVEVDAIPPAALRELVEGCITAHIDDGEYRRLLEVEAAERESLLLIARVWGRALASLDHGEAAGEAVGRA